MSNSKIRVTARVKDMQGELEIIDGLFNVIAEGFGILETELTPGIYKARANIGDIKHEELFVVAPDVAPITIEIESLKFPTPIPLENTSTSHEYHQQALYDATHERPVAVELGQGASLLLIVRDPSDANFTQQHSSPEIRENYRRSFGGFRLRDKDGNLLLNFDEVACPNPDWGYVVSSVEMNPGFYVLNYEPENGKHVAMPIHLVQNWQSQICILVNFPKGIESPGSPDLPGRSIMLAPADKPFNPNDQLLRLTEIARYSFADGRSIITGDLINELPQRKLDNPILELIYAHQILMGKRPDSSLLKLLVERLTQMLGADFPDVLALGLALDHLNGVKPEHVNEPPLPPLLRASWKILTHYPELYPADSFLCNSAARLVSRGIWFAWRSFTPRSEWDSENLLAMGVEALSSYDDIVSFARHHLLGTFISHAKERIVQHKSHYETSDAFETVVMLARHLPWETLFNRFLTNIEERDLMSNLTSLQKSLLPTLQLIHERLDEDGNGFSVEEFEQLLDGLHVPLSVLCESLLDLATKSSVGRRDEAEQLYASAASAASDDELGANG